MIGAGRGFVGVGVFSLRRPDCAPARSVIPQTVKASRINTRQANDRRYVGLKRVFNAPRAKQLVVRLFPGAKYSTLSELIRPEIDAGHVSYETGGDLVLRAAQAARK